MASATLECENIIIRRRRKRLPPPELCSVAVEPCTWPPIPVDLTNADDEGIREACPLPLHGDILTPAEGSTAESNLIYSEPNGSHSESALPASGSSVPDQHEKQPITVHEVLQDMTRSKAGSKKYGRRNRLGTVKLDAHYNDSEQCRTSPMMALQAPSTSNCETQTTRNDRGGRRISAYPPGRRIQPEHVSRQVSHLRRKKRFAKSLAQRLFEADVFSSGTSSRSAGVTPDSDQNNPAHTSSRRPLQFITSLNLTPSLEGRIYGIKKAPSSSGDSEIQPVSQPEDDDSVPDAVQDDDDDCLATVVQSVTVSGSGDKLSCRNWDGDPTRPGKRTRTRARVSHADAVRASGKGAFRTRHRHAGVGKQSSAQVVPHNNFDYVPLPLVLLETPSRDWRIAVRKPPQSCTAVVQAAGSGAGHARASKHHARIY